MNGAEGFILKWRSIYKWSKVATPISVQVRKYGLLQPQRKFEKNTCRLAIGSEKYLL